MIDQERCIRNNKTGQSSDFFLHIPPDVDGKYLYTEKNRTMKIEQNVIDQIVAQAQKRCPHRELWLFVRKRWRGNRELPHDQHRPRRGAL